MRRENPAQTSDELKAAGRMGTDAAALFTLQFPENGELIVSSITVDGRTGAPLSSFDEFAIWISFTEYLAESETMGRNAARLLRLTLGLIRAAIPSDALGRRKL